MFEDLTYYMLKKAKGDKKSSQIIEILWDIKCMQQQLNCWAQISIMMKKLLYKFL
tara:strand:- start:10508 stop:10672 length:165 start_codon:yes stop_codon:yes gene_type:complete